MRWSGASFLALSALALPTLARGRLNSRCRSAASCADVAPIPHPFTRRCSRRMMSVLRINAKPASLDRIHRETRDVRSLAKSITSSGVVAMVIYGTDRAARPASVVHGQRLERRTAARVSRPDTSSKRTSPCQAPIMRRRMPLSSRD